MTTLGPLVLSFKLAQRTPSANETKRWERHTPWLLDAYTARTIRDVGLWCLAQDRRGHKWHRARRFKRAVRITRHSPRELDYDNLVAGCKALLDGLTLARAIVDDSPKWVAVEYVQTKGEGVTVEVFELKETR